MKSLCSKGLGPVLAVAFLILAPVGCGRLQELTSQQSERAGEAESEQALQAAAEAAARAEEEARARALAEAEADAAREELEATERELAEKAARLAEREEQLERQRLLQEEQARRQREEARLASRQAEIEAREREILERERELEAREVEVALAEEELWETSGGADVEEDGQSADEVAWVADQDADLADHSGSADREANPPVRTSRASLRPGKVFEVEFLETVSSRTSRVGDTFAGRLVQDLRAEDGTLVIPAGAEVVGEVTEATPLKRVGGQASLGVEFTRLIAPSGEAVEIRASFAELGADKSKDKKKIIGAAVAGAILGRVLGGKGGENAVLGAAVGAAAGTAIVARGEGKDAEIPAGEIIALQLEEVVTVEVEMTGPAEPR